jgi:probable rRNA maturation factor
VKVVKIFFEDVKPVRVAKNRVRHNILTVVAEEDFIAGEICIIICSDSYLLNLNREYMKHDYYTDIITFNYSEGRVVSGDLFISLDRIRDNAKMFNVHYLAELERVVYHGVLHMVGYDDKSKEEAKRMRSREDYYIEKFGRSQLNNNV